MFTLELNTFLCMCVCVCVCVDYFCVLCVVVYVIDSVWVCMCGCVYYDTCAAWQIRDWLRNESVAEVAWQLGI